MKLNFSEEDNKAVEWCEQNYKSLTDEYKKIMMEQYILFCKNLSRIHLKIHQMRFCLENAICAKFW